MHLKGVNNMACLILAVERSWLALGRLFVSSFAQMGLENSLLAM